MVANTQKSFLCFALAGGVLALLLTGCGQSNYKTYEECRLKELEKLTRTGKDLIPEAIDVITDYCLDLEADRNLEEENKKSKDQQPPKAIADPNWKSVNKKHSDGTRYFIDINNIEVSGSIKTFWLKELKKGQTLEGDSFRRWQINVDCVAGTLTHVFYEKIVSGKQKEERTAPWTEATIAPGSTSARIFNDLCERK